MFIVGLGAFFFGLLLGWLCYRALRLKAGANALAEIVTIIGVLGGAAVLALFKSDVLFGWYATGLVVGFFAYLAIDLLLYGNQEAQPWRAILIGQTTPPARPSTVPSADGESAG